MRKRISGLIIAGLLIVPATQALALTAAGTTISNTASVVYSVNSQVQPAVTSNFDTNGDGSMDIAGATTFTVDRKVDLTVSKQDGTEVSGANGATVAILFQITNTSNETLAFALAAANTSGATNPFNASNPADTVDAQSFTYDYYDQSTSAWVTGVTAIPSIPAGESRNVRVQTLLPAAASNGSVGVIVLTATATEVGGAALSDTVTNTYNTKDTVLADGTGYTDSARDAKYSAASAFVISSAVITVNKASSVIDDGITGPGVEYAIPGATMRYAITITNTGTQPATSITVSDSLVTEITAGRLAYKPGTITVTAPNINSGSIKTLSDGTGDDEGDYNITAPSAVTVSGISLNAAQVATVTFDVIIQ